MVQRRLERYEAAVPVVLHEMSLGSRQKSMTANVSTHGFAMFTDKHLPVGARVRVELSLPGPQNQVTGVATVVRSTARLTDRTGLTHPGLAFDFVAFDKGCLNQWRNYISALGGGPEDTAGGPDDGATTYMVKPEERGRLWAFFHNDLPRQLTRIETAISRPVDTPVELVVVHPDTAAEWSLFATVEAFSERGRGRGPMLTLALESLDGRARGNFRTFIETGEPYRATEPEPEPTPTPTPAPDPREQTPEPLPIRNIQAIKRPATFAAFFDEYTEAMDSEENAVRVGAPMDDEDDTAYE